MLGLVDDAEAVGLDLAQVATDEIGGAVESLRSSVSGSGSATFRSLAALRMRLLMVRVSPYFSSPLFGSASRRR